jgi:hypothetical protein
MFVFINNPCTGQLFFVFRGEVNTKMRISTSDPPSPTLERQNGTTFSFRREGAHHHRTGTHPHLLSSRRKPRRYVFFHCILFVCGWSILSCLDGRWFSGSSRVLSTLRFWCQCACMRCLRRSWSTLTSMYSIQLVCRIALYVIIVS